MILTREPLPPRWLLTIEHRTGNPIVHASSNGTGTFEFTTYAHQHGWIRSDLSEWGWLTSCPGYTSCIRLFAARPR